MSRPKPIVILSSKSSAGKAEQVLVASAIYAVFHDGKPINVKTVQDNLFGNTNKYRKVSFSNSGHAFNLAEKLNKMFNTDKFSVYELTDGKLIVEPSVD